MLRCWLVGFLLFGLAAGCGGESVTAPEPSPSVTPVATPSPTAVKVEPPELPERARLNTKAGAEAFLRHYVDLVNYAQATGETGALSAAASPGCRACAAFERRVDDVYGKGGTIETSGLRVIRTSSMRVAPSIWLVSVVSRAGEEKVRIPGKPVQTVPTERTRLNFTLEYRRAWSVRGVVIP